MNKITTPRKPCPIEICLTKAQLIKQGICTEYHLKYYHQLKTNWDYCNWKRSCKNANLKVNWKWMKKNAYKLSDKSTEIDTNKKETKNSSWTARRKKNLVMTSSSPEMNSTTSTLVHENSPLQSLSSESTSGSSKSSSPYSSPSTFFNSKKEKTIDLSDSFEPLFSVIPEKEIMTNSSDLPKPPLFAHPEFAWKSDSITDELFDADILNHGLRI